MNGLAIFFAILIYLIIATYTFIFNMYEILNSKNTKTIGFALLWPLYLIKFILIEIFKVIFTNWNINK